MFLEWHYLIHHTAAVTMEVLTDSKIHLLSNGEIMELLQRDVKENKKRLAIEARKQKQRGRKNGNEKDRKVKNKFEHRDWIQERVLEYLKGTPCVNIPTSKLNELKSRCISKGSPSHSQAKKKRRTLSDPTASPKLKSPSKSLPPGYGLTEAEALQILNFMPQEPVEIHLMVDDLHDRMSETKQEEFLNMIRSYNTSVKTPENGNNGNDAKDKHGGTDADEIVDDSIEMLEKAGNHALNDEEDPAMKIKEEI